MHHHQYWEMGGRYLFAEWTTEKIELIPQDSNMGFKRYELGKDTC